MNNLKIVGIGVAVFAGLFLIIMAVAVATFDSSTDKENLQNEIQVLERANQILEQENDRLKNNKNPNLDNLQSKLQTLQRDNKKIVEENDNLRNDIKSSLILESKQEKEKLYQEDKIKKNCSLFCDSTGYQPKWAEGMGDMQSNSKCMSVIDDYGSKDYNWCMEHSGKILDDMMEDLN